MVLVFTSQLSGVRISHRPPPFQPFPDEKAQEPKVLRHRRPKVRLGKLGDALVAVVWPDGASRKRFRISRNVSQWKELSDQLDGATNGYAYRPLADAAVKTILHQRLRNAQSRSTRLAWSIDITLDWLVALYDDQKGLCALTSLPLDTGNVRAAGGRDRRPFRPSLDRIDSTKGYTKDNVRLVCSCVNYALGPWGEAVLRVMAGALVGGSLAGRS
jgi:hypothetical protein